LPKLSKQNPTVAVSPLYCDHSSPPLHTSPRYPPPSLHTSSASLTITRRTPKKINIYWILHFPRTPRIIVLSPPRRVSDPVQLTRQYKCYKKSKTKSPVSCMLVCMSVYHLQSILSVLLPLCCPPLFSAPFSSSCYRYRCCWCCPCCTHSTRCCCCCCCVQCLCLHQGVSLITGSDQKRYLNQSRVNPAGLKHIYINATALTLQGKKRYLCGVMSERYGIYI